MRFLLLFPIRLYWLIIPATRRRTCLFEESCSHFVYRITVTKGLLKGIAAFKKRFNQCRPGYKLLWNEDLKAFELRLKDGSSIENKDISKNILPRISKIKD